MTADPRGADTVAATEGGPAVVAPEVGVVLRGADPVEDTALELPLADLEWEARRAREAAVRAEIRMGRLRLASYCLTLSSCVFALMTFMYVVQGAGDSDVTFLGLGVMFAVVTAALLWAAVWVTRSGEAYSYP
ncbi:MAG TPA: hypothetical protein VHV82_14120 [Sporichthyaceae bacterium]|nr:hypothetical protein [Sporichthyaceae bacterium]